jgi:hypothetical protein
MLFRFSLSMKMLQNILGFLVVVMHVSGVSVICNGLYWCFSYKIHIYIYSVSVATACPIICGLSILNYYILLLLLLMMVS